ncbi:uncharacterized protein LOC142171540 [Nicotiana tabacum]|uniref:Uncharacterized protein LOC142171540 n=1 Tax=Nicotiana tabacum TaxID=4097 RepID=A0AC58SZH3_TOBAC
MVIALKHSFDGLQLSQQTKDNASTLTARDKVLQSSEGILGPNPYCVNATRNHNLVFPPFNEENMKTWMYRIEQYFSEDETPLNQRVRLVAMNLDDEALAWHQSYLKCRNLLVCDEYIAELIETFSGDFSDPMLELKQLKQTGSIREFQFAFDRLVAQCNLTVEQAISCFLGGLKKELVHPIMMHEPKTLAKTYRLARLAEATLAANARVHKHSTAYAAARRNSYESPVVRNTSYQAVVPAPRLTLSAATNAVVPRNRRTISPVEMQAKRAQGLCYFCDENTRFATNVIFLNICLYWSLSHRKSPLRKKETFSMMLNYLLKNGLLLRVITHTSHCVL